ISDRPSFREDSRGRATRIPPAILRRVRADEKESIQAGRTRSLARRGGASRNGGSRFQCSYLRLQFRDARPAARQALNLAARIASRNERVRIPGLPTAHRVEALGEIREDTVGYQDSCACCALTKRRPPSRLLVAAVV